MDQSNFTELANLAIGLDSMPTLAMPRFLHSTRVVPVPANGSSTVCSGRMANRSR